MEIVRLNINKNITPMKSTGWVSSFIDACCKMDILALEQILDDDIIINDTSKWGFLSRVRDSFNRTKKNGNTKLVFTLMVCGGCIRGKEVHDFSGVQPYSGIAFRIEIENDILKDISICGVPISSQRYLQEFNRWGK